MLLQIKETPFFLPANRIFVLENADELILQENQTRKEFQSKLFDLLDNREENERNEKGEKGYMRNGTEKGERRKGKK